MGSLCIPLVLVGHPPFFSRCRKISQAPAISVVNVFCVRFGETHSSSTASRGVRTRQVSISLFFFTRGYHREPRLQFVSPLYFSQHPNQPSRRRGSTKIQGSTRARVTPTTRTDREAGSRPSDLPQLITRHQTLYPGMYSTFFFLVSIPCGSAPSVSISEILRANHVR